MPGPAPKPADQRARRNATVAMTQLPAAGRSGRAPKWPLIGDIKYETDIALVKLAMKDIEQEISWASTAKERSSLRRKLDRSKQKLAKIEAMKKATTAVEKQIWTELWKTPQATQWERSGWFRDVAQYARHKANAECGSLDDAKEARMLADRLGLTPLALLRLRWEVADAPGGMTKATTTRKPAGSRARRQHLSLVDPTPPKDE